MLKSVESKEAAKQARKALKVAFPGSKFSVKSEIGSLSVSWENGATLAQVEEVMSAFKGIESTLNPYTDARTIELMDNGSGAYFDVSSISYNREVGDEKRESAIREVLDYMKVSKNEALALWKGDDEQKVLNACHIFGVLNVGYSDECFGSFISNIVKGRAYAA